MAAGERVIINLIPFPATNEVTNQTTTHLCTSNYHIAIAVNLLNLGRVILKWCI